MESGTVPPQPSRLPGSRSSCWTPTPSPCWTNTQGSTPHLLFLLLFGYLVFCQGPIPHVLFLLLSGYLVFYMLFSCVFSIHKYFLKRFFFSKKFFKLFFYSTLFNTATSAASHIPLCICITRMLSAH